MGLSVLPLQYEVVTFDIIRDHQKLDIDYDVTQIAANVNQLGFMSDS
uniref:Uncharacterized protein n=1 Tax=Rhizophora mucronata TaxID=61149 RepID=A0A2P2IS52_RHIMU